MNLNIKRKVLILFLLTCTIPLNRIHAHNIIKLITIKTDSIEQLNINFKKKLSNIEVQKIKDSIIDIEQEIVDENDSFNIDKLKLSNKVGLLDKRLQATNFLIFHYYYLKEKDSTLKYTTILKNDLKKLSNINYFPDKVIRLHANLSYILSRYYGYNEEVIAIHKKSHYLSLKNNYNRGIINAVILTANLILENNPNDIELDIEEKNIERLKERYWKDSIRHHCINNTLSKIYLAKGHYQKAEKLALEIKINSDTDYRNGIRQILLSQIFYHKNNINKALQATQQAVFHLKKSIQYREDLANAYYYQFLYYKQLKDSKNAIIAIEYAINNVLSLPKEVIYIDSMIDYLQKTGNSKRIEYFKAKKQVLIATITSNKLPKTDSFFIEKMKKEDTQKSIMSLTKKIDYKNSEEVILSISILLLIYFFYYKKTNQMTPSLVKEETKDMKLEIQKREDELQLVAIKVANRISKLKELRNMTSHNNIEYTNIKKFNYLINELIDSGKSLNEISSRLTSQYPGIVKILLQIHPSLSNTEIKYCILTNLDLTLKEIAETLHVAPASVKHAKSMIKKKMGFSKELTLKTYLNNLFYEKHVA